MTGEAVQSSMFPIQLKTRPCVVVELPQCPRIGVVTTLAFRSQLLLVDIIRLMTGTAFLPGLPECCRQMALLAGHNSMQPD